MLKKILSLVSNFNKKPETSKEEQDAFKYEALKYYNLEKYIEAKKCDDFIFENRDFDA
tara:strand:+ start:173 stop:346 length:174 start_codon:yes stop_codon:yes gene_type:complete